MFLFLIVLFLWIAGSLISFLLFFRFPSYPSFSPPTTASTIGKKSSSTQVFAFSFAGFPCFCLWAWSDVRRSALLQGPSGWRSSQRSRRRGWARTTCPLWPTNPTRWCAPPSWKSLTPSPRATGPHGTEDLPQSRPQPPLLLLLLQVGTSS